MSGIYLTWLADVLRAAGLTVVDSGYGIDGWETRARSSGGFPSTPLGVQWHHTASQTSPANDINWQINGCDDAPVGNMTIMRDGSVWLVAAGAANCAGKGGPLTLSRGDIPKDSGNTKSVAIEVANNGVGESWPIAQVNSYFVASNAINAKLGNRPDDVYTHAIGTGNGWTDRKIDPARGNSVEGPWKPREVNSSGTWSLDDIRAECLARAGEMPPTPDNGDDDDMAYACEGIWILGDPGGNPYGMTVAVYAGGYKTWIPDNNALGAKQALCSLHGVKPDTQVQTDVDMWRAFGPLVGAIPDGYDSFGVPL